MMDGAILVSFSSMKGAGSSYVCEGKVCGEDLACFIISGVLNRGIDNPARANVSYCYSTLIVTPGILDNKTAELMACPQGNNYRSLNVTCEVTGHRNTSEITQIQDPQLFQIAGKSICDMVAALPLYHGTLFFFCVCRSARYARFTVNYVLLLPF